MKKIVLTFGVISGLISAGLMLGVVSFVDRIGFDKGLYLGYATIVLSFLFVFFGIRSYRENVGRGQISFGRGFTVGILITLISCAFYVGMWLIVYYNFFPDFGDSYAAYIMDQSRAAGASADEIAKQAAEMSDMKRMLANPFLNAAVTFLEPFPVGLLITLISALVLRKRGEAPDKPDLVRTGNLHNAQSH